MRKKIVIAVLLIILILSTNIIVTFAATKSELQNQQNEIQDKINEAEEKQQEVGEKINQATEQIQELTAQINQYQGQIDELDGQLAQLESSISETEAQLEEAENQYIKQEKALQERIVAQYEAGETTYLDVILGGGSLWDMISNWQIVSDIAEMDNQLLEQIQANKIEIEEAKKSLESNKAQVETLKNSKEQTAKALKNSQTQKEQQVSELNEEDKLLQEEIEELQAQNRQLEAQINAAADKYSDKIANLGGDGTFQRPVASGVITATMYYSSGTYHGALDYGIPIGTTIYAAGDGVVLAAGWRQSGFGNCTIIQHSNGLRTYYAHGNGVFYVSEGETVKKGQAIMQSGNSGNSTGPHLHFEVRVSPYSWVYGGGYGDCRRDPRNYL